MAENVTSTPELAQKGTIESLFKAIAEDAKRCRNITIRTGKAHEVYDPEALVIMGVIDTPLRWLKKQSDFIDQSQSSIIVNRDDMEIALSINHHDHFSDTIAGILKISTEFQRFGINSGKYTTGLELSDLIRMNRSCFESKEKAMELVTIMRNFKATVNRAIEASDDKKGNRSVFVRQVVESNQPPSFDLFIPIFKGQPRQRFTVEIDIDPDTLQCTLVSPDAQDMIDETRDKLIDDVLHDIETFCPVLPIIEV